MNKAQTLADFISFECEPQSMLTDTEADLLEQKIAAAAKVEDKGQLRRTLSSFCIVYICTRNIALNASERVDKSLVALHDMWLRRGDLSPVELWEMRQRMPHTLWNEWFRQWDAKQRLFDVDPAQLPDDMLDEQQKAEAKDPKSSFPDGEEPSPSK